MNLLIATLLTSTSYGFNVGPFGASNFRNDKSRQSTLLDATKIGIFYGTSTGSTAEVAELISEAFGDDATEPIEIEEIAGEVAGTFRQYDALIVGTPTWNTGADIERSGTGWDELYYNELQDAGNLHSSDFKGKKVAVFGLGDSEGYGDNYADASGELHDVFEKLGCRMMGYTSQDGYFHSASKAIRGNLFCGLMNDMVNQEDMAEERVEKWAEQLISEGILESAGVESSNSESVTTPVVSIKEDLSSIEVEQKVLEDNSLLLEEEIVVSSVETTIEKNDGESFTPHYNPKTGITMWTSPDGRKSYFTKSPPKMA